MRSFRLPLTKNAPINRTRIAGRSPYLDQYVRTPNRLAFGERTVIVMSSKVAQKSYGTEKRCVALALRRSAAAGPIAS